MSETRETQMAGSRAAGPRAADDASASDLVKALSEQTSRLVKQEMELAKVETKDEMAKVGKAFPGYGFESHVGYSTPEHFAALRQHGPCPHHRRSFSPVRVEIFDDVLHGLFVLLVGY